MEWIGRAFIAAWLLVFLYVMFSGKGLSPDRKRKASPRKSP
jgi:hypothetical protein